MSSCMFRHTHRGVGRDFSREGGGDVLNVIYQKGCFCTDLFPNTYIGNVSNVSDPFLRPA